MTTVSNIQLDRRLMLKLTYVSQCNCMYSVVCQITTPSVSAIHHRLRYRSPRISPRQPRFVLQFFPIPSVMQLGLSENLSALVARRFTAAKDGGHLIFSTTHLSIITTAGIPVCPPFPSLPQENALSHCPISSTSSATVQPLP